MDQNKWRQIFYRFHLLRRSQNFKIIFVGSCSFAIGSLSTMFFLYPRFLKVFPDNFLEKVYAVTPVVRSMGKILEIPQIPSNSLKDVPDGNFNITLTNYQSVGLPTEAPIRVFDAFLLSYDRRLRIPKWVIEHLPPHKMTGENYVKRNQLEFYEDILEDEAFRSTLKDYYSSGYDRGHMVAAGNNKFTNLNTMGQTFILSNIAPQVGQGFNRDAWNSLEIYIRELARNSFDTYVVTGPLFLSQKDPTTQKRFVKYEVIGSQNVAVPTHFFKVAAVKEKSTSPWTLVAWVMPNIALPREKINVNQFIVSVKDVEKAAGLKIFSLINK